MSQWTHRTLIVQDSDVEFARLLTATIAGSSGDGMWNTPLSETGNLPATHWISSGLITAEFAELLPLTQHTYTLIQLPSIEPNSALEDVVNEVGASAATVLGVVNVYDDPFVLSHETVKVYNEPVVLSQGNAQTCVYVANQNGLVVSPEQIESLFANSSITHEDAFEALSRMGLKMITETGAIE